MTADQTDLSGRLARARIMLRLESDLADRLAGALELARKDMRTQEDEMMIELVLEEHRQARVPL